MFRMVESALCALARAAACDPDILFVTTGFGIEHNLQGLNYLAGNTVAFDTPTQA